VSPALGREPHFSHFSPTFRARHPNLSPLEFLPWCGSELVSLLSLFFDFPPLRVIPQVTRPLAYPPEKTVSLIRRGHFPCFEFFILAPILDPLSVDGLPRECLAMTFFPAADVRVSPLCHILL